MTHGKFEIADFCAIQKLVHSYPKRLDSGDLKGVGQLFADADVYFERMEEPVRSNPKIIAEMFADFLRLYAGKPRTRHAIVNLIIEPAETTAVDPAVLKATATSTVIVFQATDDLPLQPIITGDYHDRFERHNGSWRFSERRITNDLFGNLSAHGKYEIGPD